MSNRNRPSGIERELRRRRQRRMAELNRNDHEIFTMMLKITLAALAVIIGICIWFWAAVQQAQEVEAAVLRSHRITDGSMYSWGPGVTPGQNQNCPILVPELPDFPPVDGEPPAAIEIRMATKAETIPEERWESLGRWKLTAYCPLECCNGKGRAWTTASGAPMVVGDTVAAVGLPYGTKIKIGDRVYTVTDTGRLEKNQLDILHESHAAAKRFGVQRAEVFVLRK